MATEGDYDQIVVGGGPAGLSRAFWLLREQPDARLLVVEAGHRLGGWIRTGHVDGYTLEFGPQGFRPDGPAVDAFLRATGLGDQVVSCAATARRRWLIQGDDMHELPGTPRALLGSPLMPMGSKLRLLGELAVRSRGVAGESAAEFVDRRFGRAAVPMVEAMMHGIYAGDAHELEAESVLPTAVAMEADAGSVLRGLRKRRRQLARPQVAPAVCTFGGGMEQSVEALADALGDRILTGAPVARITRDGAGFAVGVAGPSGRRLWARQVCLTAPPAATANMVRDLDGELAGLVGGIPTVSVASTYLGYPRDAVPDAVDGFGFLAARGALGPVLGAIFSSRVFPAQAPADRVLFRVMSGGFGFPKEVDRDDGELVLQGSDLLAERLGLTGPPVFAHVSRARDGIPQYLRGHGRRLEQIAARVRAHPGLTLAGAGYRKVSVVGQWARQGSTP